MRALRLAARCASLWLGAAALAGCVPILSADTRVTFYPEEAWEARVEVVFSGQQLAFVGGQLESALDEHIAQLRAASTEAEWVRLEPGDDGNVPYRITASGQGLNRLNDAFFNSRAVLYVDEGSGLIVFRYSPTASMFGVIPHQTFTLVGGSIASTNGRQLSNGTVQWVNPQGDLEAMLTPASRAAWLPFALIGTGGLLLAGAAFGLVRRFRSPPTAPYAASPLVGTAVTYPDACANCGAAVPAEARFCPRCGAAR